jgi:hypothetical protein
MLVQVYDTFCNSKIVRLRDFVEQFKDEFEDLITLALAVSKSINSLRRFEEPSPV